MRPNTATRKQPAGMMARLTAALTCVMIASTSLSGAMAQESGLRLNTKDENTSILASPLQKKKKKLAKKKTGQTEVAPPAPRYEPADLDSAAATPDTAAADSPLADANGPEPVSSAAAPILARRPQSGADSQAGQVANSADETQVAATGPAVSSPDAPLVSSERQDEIPDAAAGLDAGALERDGMTRARPDNSREPAIDSRTKTADTDPYAAPGIQAGAFLLRPTLDQGLTWTNNADASDTGAQSVISETRLKLRAESNWLRHQLNIEANGAFRKSLSGQDVSDPAFGLAADLRLDMTTALTINSRASWEHSRESASAPALMTGPFTRPTLDTLQASVGANYDPGLFSVGLTGQVTRQIYGDALNSSGVTVPQDDRNNTFATLTVRGAYDLSPALSPFIEAEIGRRIYDNSVDSFGKHRATVRYGARAGIAANLGEKLNGELAAGWLTENVDDPTLDDVTGLDIRGTVNWSPMRGTNVGLTLATTVEPSTYSTSSGSVLHSVNATLTHKLRSNLDLTLGAGAAWRHYDRGYFEDRIVSGEAGLTWWANRYAGINGKIRHEETMNANKSRAYGATSVYLGVTLRR